MSLDQEYCDARDAYCKVVSKVVDRLVEITRRPLTDDFMKGVIKSAGIAEPYTTEDFEDIICETVEEYTAKLFSDERIAKYRVVIEAVESNAPTAEQITPGTGNATWKDMQNIIHKCLESDVVGFTANYLPDSDPLKEEFLLIQANYHRIYTLVEKADPHSIHVVVNVVAEGEGEEPPAPSIT